MKRFLCLRSATLALLLAALPLPATAERGELQGEQPRFLQDLWQAAANFLSKLEPPALPEAIFLFTSPEAAQECGEGELPADPIPTLGADMDPNG